jgi:hypothetical protein
LLELSDVSITSSVIVSESPKFALGGGSEKGRNLNSS